MNRPAGDTTRRELQERVASLSVRDAQRFGKELRSRKDLTDETFLASIAAAEQRIASRSTLLPTVTYPEELPVTSRRTDIAEAIGNSQVVIVAGDTGSGKSTQLPKICLELGLGVRGLIGHTQPRRLAARTVAERIAEELHSPIGEIVGYTVRFNDRVSDNTLLKVMTDGILLTEIQRDRDLLKYDTLIIDEAHERSLNIDFLLGYLTRLLPRRPDLKLIVTSATIDTQRFAEHFAKHLGTTVPVIEVSGRTFPVEVRYREFAVDADDDRDQPQAIADAIAELEMEGPGDILVFLSGEREIRDAADTLAQTAKGPHAPEILPLYARLSSAEQHRIFEPHSKRRVVLATNVAETSLTVPGVRYVVDTGTARISRYSKRLKVQQLPIEAISQASANQRSGRCGRLGPGVAIRLFSEEDYAKRDAFTEPEILRTNLASVILQMAAFDFGAIETFPFVEPPESQSIRDGLALLVELGAFDAHENITPLGKRLAKLPLDPRLGRMVLEAERLGCVREVTILAAALSIQDPRDRPVEKRQQADEFHKRFADESSDFVSILKLWEYLKEQQQELSGNQFRKRCRAEFLNHLRIREWQDVFRQLREVARDLGIAIGGPASTKGAHHNNIHDNIHQALLSGLLTHVGIRDDEIAEPTRNTNAKNQKDQRPPRPQKGREFKGVRNSRFAIAPGSVLSRRPPKWVMASELVETNRLWARSCAQIDPAWIERVGEHLVKRTHSEPRWDAEKGAAVVTERVLLSGLSIVEGRTVLLANVDQKLARELFIRHALVQHEWRAHHKFIDKNRRLVHELLALESRVRRRDLLANDDALYEFFADRVPEGIVSARHFDRWWKTMQQTFPDLLTFTREDIVDADVLNSLSLDAFPDRWTTPGAALRIGYLYDPASDDDGVTVEIPLVQLHALRPQEFQWHVAGHRVELVSELIRLMPKTARRQLVPAPEYAEAFLERADSAKPLIPQINDILGHIAGTPIALATDALEKLAPHLRIRFEVKDAKGRILGTGRDLRSLMNEFGQSARTEVANALPNIERNDVRAWDFGELPKVVEGRVGRQQVRGYPALVDEGRSLALRVLTSERAQEQAMWLGTQRLLEMSLADSAKRVRKTVSSSTPVMLALSRHGDIDGMLADCVSSAVELLLARHGGPVWDAAAFDTLKKQVADDVVEVAVPAAKHAAEILDRNDRIEERLATLTSQNYDAAVVDITAQLHQLLPDGFILAIGVARLPDIVRYLTAIERRLDKLVSEPVKDAQKMARIQVLDRLCNASSNAATIVRVRWMLEELRVSVFAQQLGTNGAISEERIRKELGVMGR